jgi:6-phosphogluconolactonase
MVVSVVRRRRDGAVTVAPAAAVEMLPSVEALMEAAAERFTAIAGATARDGGRFVVALAGGSTPRALYTLLATDRFARRIDWTRVHVCFGDERCVPPGDPASNYRMASEALLARVPIPSAQVHRMRGEDDPATAAAAYERELRALFATADGPPRTARGARFDLVLLGMGDNGHTASLFPGLPAVRESRRWIVAARPAEVETARLTLTPPVIDAAAEVVFLVAGAEKAAMLRRVLRGPYDPDQLPAQIVRPTAGRLTWLVDAAAASPL